MQGIRVEQDSQEDDYEQEAYGQAGADPGGGGLGVSTPPPPLLGGNLQTLKRGENVTCLCANAAHFST